MAESKPNAIGRVRMFFPRDASHRSMISDKLTRMSCATSNRRVCFGTLATAEETPFSREQPFSIHVSVVFVFHESQTALRFVMKS